MNTAFLNGKDSPLNGASKLSYKGLEMFPYHRACLLNGQSLNLTKTEFSILQVLMENLGHTVSVREMSDRIWNDAVYINRKDSVAIHIHHLREKMDDTLKPLNYVKTVWGVGYMLEKEENL